MKTILVPTDFSENANNALDYAIGFAKNTDARLILAHGYFSVFNDPNTPSKHFLDQISENKTKAETMLKNLSVRVESENIPCETINREEMAVELILEIEDQRKPDFIIMGTKGASGIINEIIGTNTSKVIKKAKCPVIAIPLKEYFRPLKKIIFATDYHNGDIDALEKIIEMGKQSEPEIIMIHVSDLTFYDDNEESEYLERFMSNVESKIKYKKMDFRLVDGANMFNTFEAIIMDESPDLFAMSKYHRSIFDKLFGSSATQEMAYHTNVPLLIFHYEDQSFLF